MSEQNIYEDFTPRRERNLASGIIFILKLIARALERKVMYIVRYVTVPCHTIHALQTCGKADIPLLKCSHVRNFQ